ncbi:hypothetical protein ACIPSJ_49015 [Streptomyces sp. NPDC090088]|uniref:hypothetical protein n=1 Tax=Streptomyces sp. NPDC090088 TaxID=3365944 RepID=UPI00382C90CF
MTLTTRRFGSARVTAGGSWTVGIAVSGGQSVSLRIRPAGAVPTWAEVDQVLAREGFTRTESAPRAVPGDGTRFTVRGWFRLSGRRRHPHEPDTEPGSRPDTVAVTLPASEVAGIRQALDALRSAQPWRRDGFATVRTGLDEADTVTVLLPADEAGSLLSALTGIESWRTKIGDDAVRALRELHHHLERGRPVADPWPRVRDTLQTALREALSRPGAEGLAARDELLAIIGRFADAHRTATAADDAVQQRLQAERAERAEPEVPGPAR